MRKKYVQLEFKSQDQAWYDISLKMNGSQLKVHYNEFPEEEDETLVLENFNSLEDLRSIFRFSSKQLQDQHCGKVKESMAICASYSNDAHDMRFFDAIVQQVCRSRHRLVDGEEECRCTFKVLWKDGPCASKTTSVSCENICLLTPGSIESHPMIKAFLKLIEENVDCKVQSLGRNPPNKKAANMKGSNTTNCKDKQGEPGKTPRIMVSASDLERNCIISGQERVENLSGTFKQNLDIDRLKNRIEAVLPSKNEVAYNTLHVPSVSSQSCKMEKKTDDGLNAVENAVTGSEVLLRYLVSSSSELGIPDISRYNIGSQINISSSSHGENGIKMLNTTDEAPLGTTIKSTDEASHGDVFVLKREKTCFDSVRKEESLNLDLNSMPVELDQRHLDIPTPTVGFYSNANNNNRKDNLFLGLDNNVGIHEIKRPFCSDGFEAEDCDFIQIEKRGFNAIGNDIASNSVCLTTDIRNKECKLSDNHSLSACRGIRRPSLPLFMDNWDERYNCKRVGEQLIGEENQKDEKIPEDKDGKNKFLASSWGKGKRQKHISNEMFAGERKVQENNLTGENLKSSKKIQEGNDFDGVDTLSSCCLTSHLKHNTSHNTMKPLDFSIDMEALVDQSLVNEEMGKSVNDSKQSVEQIISNQVPVCEIPFEVVEMLSDNKSHVPHLQSNVSYDINAQRSICLSASPVKINIRNDPSGSFRDSSDHPDETVNKVDAVKGITKHTKFNRKEKSSPGFLSDEENDHGISRKKLDNGILDLSWQLGNEGLSTAEKIKEDHTCKSGCHKNGKSWNKYDPIHRCKSEGQKNVPAIKHRNNGHSISEKSNCCSDYSDATDMPSFHNEQNRERCRSHLISEECEKVIPTSRKVHSRLSELHARQTSITMSYQYRTFSGNSITVHCEHSSECRCCELHSCDTSASSEDESFDGDITGCIKFPNCKYCGKSIIPMVSSKRTSTNICRGTQEARCGCSGTGFGHCSENMRTEERQIHNSEVLVLDNLEKDVRPSTVKEVISSVTYGVVQVYILPSPKFEQFTRGFVWFQDHASLMKALVFLLDDKFLIMSSNGRPWVAIHVDNGVCKDIFGGYTIESEDSKHYYSKASSSSKILFVYKGTDEYERAKRRKNAFLEFRDHLAILHKRLELDEKQLVPSPGTD